jgi:hypothetical protein
MTPNEVSNAMKAAGYRLSYRYMGRSWQGEVANQVFVLRRVRISEGAEVVRKEDYETAKKESRSATRPARRGRTSQVSSTRSTPRRSTPTGSARQRWGDMGARPSHGVSRASIAHSANGNAPVPDLSLRTSYPILPSTLPTS